MTVKIPIKGDVVDSDTAAFYSYFSMQCVSPQEISDALQEADGDDVELDINSGGGDVFAGFEIYTTLRNYSGNVNAIVSGLAASAASTIAMAANNLKMSPVAQIMIHQAQSVLQGNTDDLTHEAGVLQGIDQSIAAAYEQRTGIGQGELLNMMAKETWLGAKDAVDKGFADEIMFNDKPAVYNSVSPIPSKAALAKFKTLLAKETTPKEPAQSNTDKNSQPTDELLASKLAVLADK